MRFENDPPAVNLSSARGPPAARWDLPELHKLLNQLGKGDILAVWKLDRLSRSLRDVLTIMEPVQERKASFRSLTREIY
jgi:DNA invertase Pin-like site-specific DNA recombinase